MNRLMIISTILAFLSFFVHTIVGTHEIYNPLFSSTIDEVSLHILYTCWHIVTVTLLILSFGLLWCLKNKGDESGKTLAIFISILWISFGCVFIIIALSMSGISGLLALPQWILLIPVGIFGILGSRKQ